MSNSHGGTVPIRVNRRRFLSLAATSAAGLGSLRLSGRAGTPVLPGAWPGSPPPRTRLGAPFALGVASGDPAPTGVVLWTRLAPDPLDVHGGMPQEDVPVAWQVASDEAFGRVVASGVAMATPRHGHAVHVAVEGLQAARWYWYRFRTGDELSQVGRTRTSPPGNASVDRLVFGFASCQQYEHGYYTAYRHMAAEPLDLLIHLGDYIYEHGRDVHPAPIGNVRHHVGGEAVSLTDYRRRYAQYRTDPDLQAAHAAFPWVVTWDDHEVDNDYAADRPEGHESRESFRMRRAAAYQAYWEHLPLRTPPPVAGDLRLYRRVGFGRLATFHVLDTRQYRSVQACGGGWRASCDERLDPARRMTGEDQERWLVDGLRASSTRWNVLAQQVFLAQRDVQPGPGARFSMDAWDGYPAARDRLLRTLTTANVANPIVLTGDVHAHWAADIKADFDDPDSATLGSEFVGTSVSSGGDGSVTTPHGAAVVADNPHLRFHNAQRGYVRCEVTPQRWRTDYRVVPYVSRPGAPVETRTSFIVEAGRSGMDPA
ncbi:MAG: alkaline phosphatase D family protein [Actinomycetota bacterium]|nr:alkaline phosphatase D family protein [Actinomycetota bacterium]